MLKYEKQSGGFSRIFRVSEFFCGFCTFLVGGARVGGFGSFPRSGVGVVFGSFLMGGARGGGFSEGVRSGSFPGSGVRVDGF